MENLATDLRFNLLGNEELADAILESSVDENKRVPVVRALLAARSKVFRSLLYGGYSETKETIIKIDFPEITMKMLVQFCYTDQVLELEWEDVESIIKLAAAADYYAMPQLFNLCVNKVLEKIKKDPANACLALEGSRGIASLQVIEQDALHKMRTQTEKTLLGDRNGRAAVCDLSATFLEAFLHEDDIHVNEFLLFRAVECWIRGQDSGPNKRLRPEHEKMAGLIRLKAIPPVTLRDFVLPSGIFTKDQISEAFQEQAIASQTSFGVDYKSSALRTKLPKWKDSNDTLAVSDSDHHGVQLLNVELVAGSKYRWKLEIVKSACYTWVGVASFNKDFTNEWLGKQRGGWVYGCNGSVNHATNEDDGPYNQDAREYSEGDQLVLELDLTSEEGGVLMANGQTLFTDMKADEPSGSFVPAVSLKSPGQVRLLEFCKL